MGAGNNPSLLNQCSINKSLFCVRAHHGSGGAAADFSWTRNRPHKTSFYYSVQRLMAAYSLYILVIVGESLAETCDEFTVN